MIGTCLFPYLVYKCSNAASRDDREAVGRAAA